MASGSHSQHSARRPAQPTASPYATAKRRRRAAADPRARAVAAGAGEGAAGATSTTSPRPSTRRPPTRRSTRCANGDRPATTASRRDCSTTRGRRLEGWRWSCSRSAGRCGCSPADASQSVAALCVTRSADGRWLAGRRAGWVASWAGRWALGAGGAVDLDENPADTLVRELRGGVVGHARAGARRGARAAAAPAGDVRRAGVARGGRRRDGETRPRARRVRLVAAEIDEWPDEAEAPLRLMARGCRSEERRRRPVLVRRRDWTSEQSRAARARGVQAR